MQRVGQGCRRNSGICNAHQRWKERKHTGLRRMLSFLMFLALDSLIEGHEEDRGENLSLGFVLMKSELIPEKRPELQTCS